MVGERNSPLVDTAINFIVSHQNPNGSWGSYEKERAQAGDKVDVMLHLHTTSVVVEALITASKHVETLSEPVVKIVENSGEKQKLEL